MRQYVSNWFSLIGIIVSLLGTLIIVSDIFEPMHNWYDELDNFKNIEIGLEDLNNADTSLWKVTPGGTIGINDTGFNEILMIIKINRDTININGISQIGLFTISSFHDVNEKVLMIELKENREFRAITSEYIFQEWINKNREKYILKWGLFLIIIGFTFILFSHFDNRLLR